MGDRNVRLAYCRMTLDGLQPQPQHCYGCGHCMHVAQGADVFDRSGTCPTWCRSNFFAAQDELTLRHQAGDSGVTATPEGTFSGMGSLRCINMQGSGLTVLAAGDGSAAAYTVYTSYVLVY